MPPSFAAAHHRTVAVVHLFVDALDDPLTGEAHRISAEFAAMKSGNVLVEFVVHQAKRHLDLFLRVEGPFLEGVEVDASLLELF